ncbi:MAG: hypothetical protein R6W90_01670 [Ignavibacteriaceae bacterium]
MKKIVITLFLLSTLCYGDQSILASSLVNPDTMFVVTENSPLVDSVNISEIVRSQIEAAQMSSVISSLSYVTPAKEVKTPARAEQKHEKGFFENIMHILYESKHSNVAIFLASSVFIVSMIFGRRYIIGSVSGSKGRLRKAVNLIRTEKPVRRENKKLEELRRRLSDSNNILEMSDITGKAKELRVGKGELILAAKVKAFQLSKILSR